MHRIGYATSRILADGTREWIPAPAPTIDPKLLAEKESKKIAAIEAITKKLAAAEGNMGAIYMLAADAARAGNKDALDFIFAWTQLTPGAVIDIIYNEGQQQTAVGRTGILFECGEHPEVLTALLREHKFELETLNTTITCRHDGERYREMDYKNPQGFIFFRFGNDRFSYQKPHPTNLVQLALVKQSTEILQELFKYKGINLKGAMLFAFRVQNYSSFDGSSSHYYERLYAKDFAFLKQATSLLEIALQQQGIELTAVEKVLVAIIKKENDIVLLWNNFSDPRRFLEDLDYLEQMEEKPPQTPAAARQQLSHALRNRYTHASQHLLDRADLLDGTLNFADLLTAALKSKQPEVVQKLWNHPKLTDHMFSAVGYEGNTLEVLLRHYAKVEKEDGYTTKILQSMILNLMERGVPPEDRNKRPITDLMSELTWSNHNESQLRSVLRPYTRKYECGPRACVWVKQQATDAKQFVFGLPAYFFRRAAAPAPAATHAESKSSSLTLTPHREKQQ